MPKRPSPFETSIHRQSKVHLKDHENDLAALKEMEERTLRKLLEGSRKLASGQVPSGVLVQNPGRGRERRGFMQKCVTGYITVNGKKIPENGRKAVAPTEAVSSCSFCESRTSATYKCAQCLELYCSACSFVDYESLEDMRICLSCS